MTKSTITRIAALITLFVIPTAMASDNPHCVAATDSYNVTTIQCDNGTVTITSGGGRSSVVCNAGGNDSAPKCTEVKL
ncbi:MULTISPECIES: hypothetical protein [Klebsiella]|uniref:hypothetical protein n=1 Tax=Klebsiella TaxID=570 RepID=UPI0011E4D9F6|nr:hypothetical protein [Klebsiella pneumoniae]MDV0617074.1 hypothetical protein [Klebsiella pneumoniae]HDT0667851.1 hypothetical protein [Klebsiella aerogenes]